MSGPSPCGLRRHLTKALHQQETALLNQTISILCQFFDREVPLLSNTYNWKIPKIDSFTQSGESGYTPNLALKQYLNKLWGNASSDDEKLRVAKVIVSDWGGVRGNNQNTLIKYVNAISKSAPPTPIQGVASYSKIFAIVDPQRFAIYDARVAACLNAAQINAKIKTGLAFNYVPGRNNVVGNTTTKTGFTQDPRFSTKQLVQLGWSSIRRDDTYKKYLELLFACLKERPQYSLTSLEMALFANAERECKTAMTKVPVDATISCSGRY